MTSRHPNVSTNMNDAEAEILIAEAGGKDRLRSSGSDVPFRAISAPNADVLKCCVFSQQPPSFINLNLLCQELEGGKFEPPRPIITDQHSRARTHGPPLHPGMVDKNEVEP